MKGNTVPTNIPDKLREIGKLYNAFGGSDDLERVMLEAAATLEYYEVRLLQMNRIVSQIQELNETVGRTLVDVAGMMTEVTL